MAIDINYTNEYGKLRRVMLYRPDPNEIQQKDYKKAMYRAVPSINKVMNEFDSIVKTLRMLNIEVTVLNGTRHPVPTPNMIYLRDVAFVYRDSIATARMKHDIRIPEPDKFIELAQKTVPEISRHIHKLTVGNMEGADLLINSDGSLLAYTGSRTTQKAVNELQEYYDIDNIINIQAKINNVPQHLLGGIHIIDSNLLTKRTRYCSTNIKGYDSIDFAEDEEISNKFALNIVTLGPKEILMPAGCPNTRKKLEKHGIICHEVSIDEIHKMGGGLACMVLPIERSATSNRGYF